jgi:hypothetical protein
MIVLSICLVLKKKNLGFSNTSQLTKGLKAALSVSPPDVFNSNVFFFLKMGWV